MKFDASRAESLFRELGDARYAGPDGEARVADLVASRFAAMGLDVDRRELTGSRFPRWAAFWLDWPVYGLLVTAVYGLVIRENRLIAICGLILSLFCGPWLNAVKLKRIRPGRRRSPLETAPVVIGTLPQKAAAPFRVVFLTVISGVEVDSFPFPFRGFVKRVVVYGFLCLFPTVWAMMSLTLRPTLIQDARKVDEAMAYRVLTRYLYPAFLAALWLGILMLLSREYRRWRAAGGKVPLDRRGLAALVEMARTWPRIGSRAIEPLFVVAGGQRLDYAGSREVVRLLKSEWSSKPFLLLVFFAPGTGEELFLCTNARSAWGLATLVEDAAGSLWIPYRRGDPFALLPLWPFEDCRPAVALMGSDPRAFDEESVDLPGLNRAAQLATEIALRWAKKPRDSGIPESAG